MIVYFNIFEKNTLFDKNDERTLWEKLEYNKAMSFNEDIPLFVRICMPILILFDIGVFLFSNSF